MLLPADDFENELVQKNKIVQEHYPSVKRFGSG